MHKRRGISNDTHNTRRGYLATNIPCFLQYFSKIRIGLNTSNNNCLSTIEEGIQPKEN